METTRRLLEIHRTAFQRIYDATLKELVLSEPDQAEIQGNMLILDTKVEAIADLDRKMLNLLLESDCAEEDIDTEVANADELMGKYNKLKFKVEAHLNEKDLGGTCNISKKDLGGVCNISSCHTHSGVNNTRIRWPRIEFKKFNGEIKDWLSFWSQFGRVHDDETIDDADKFQYLLQATEPKSRARQLVESYPPSVENYKKVIESLKSRFGREDLLVEVYVRELLKLVLGNLNNKIKLSSIYDKLESHLRALGTLGVTTDKCASMLFPLVESSLPEELLRAWQRSNSYNSNSAVKTRLDQLMEFLKREVENEERIVLAVSGFDVEGSKKKEFRSNKKEETIPTAAGLVNHKGSPRCAFCKGSHVSETCEEARNLSCFEKKNKLSNSGCCYRCLKFGHLAKRCAVKIECKNCKGRHATLMCWKTEQEKPSTDSGSGTAVENLANLTYSEVFLQTLVVQLHGNQKVKRVRALIDTGSQRSYTNRATLNEMGCEIIGQESMVHALFGGLNTENVKHNCYKIQLSNLYNKYACRFEVLDQPVICHNVTSIKQGPWTDELFDLGIDIADTRDGPIEILIGADVAGKLFTGRKKILKCGLVAIETSLGWTLMGKAVVQNQKTTTSYIAVTSLLSSEMLVTDLWSLDVLGISDPSSKSTKVDKEAAVMEYFVETVTRDRNGRYEVSLPWIEGHPPLPNNFNLAMKRLDGLMKKLEKDGYYNDYNNVFKEWLTENIIEEVPAVEVKEVAHYLPHRHVIKLNSATTRLRPVFDASARENSNHPSLNQCLEKGLNLIELIPTILLRFRLEKIGVISDIRKAFLQIGLSKNDRNFLRFLWRDEHGYLKMFRHVRVVFGVTCSPFLLGAVINYHLKNILSESSENSRYSVKHIDKLLKSFYVDNCVTSVESNEELEEFIETTREVMAEANFDLRGWEFTNMNQPIEPTVCPVLGMIWDKNSDTLSLSLENLKNLNTEKITKRFILSVANRIFDPIGIVSPVILCPKLLLQKAWAFELGWNTEVPEDMKKKFLDWVGELKYLTNLKIPRWLSVFPIRDVETWSLHTFVDASQECYAAAVFLRVQKGHEASIRLIQAKSRLSPIKKISIPKLELLAATIGVRLLVSVLKVFERNDIKLYFWTDSTTVLAWIKRNDIWKPFVWNRVKEIKEFSDPNCWFHIPGHLNPADLPSRGCSVQQLVEKRWWEGPSWLLRDFRDWPIQNYLVNEADVLIEKKKNVTTMISREKCDFLMYYRYFSRYEQIVRLIAWVQRFIFNVKNYGNRRIGELDTEEIIKAETIIFKLVQKECFECLEASKSSSLVLFLDNEGVLRVKTKISEREDVKNFRYPVLLPANHPVVYRLIYSKHVKNGHIGIQMLLAVLREEFWILGGRKTVKSVLSKCVVCRRYESKSFQAGPSPLPVDRVKDAAVFEVTGIDIFGHLNLKSGEKVWVCIFTCAVYRAIHLEIVSSLSTECFLQALRRFIARRGRPSRIYSANGTGFVGAANAFASLD